MFLLKQKSIKIKIREDTIKEHRKTIYLLSLLILAIYLIYPHLDYQPYLAQGDHGRDLYGFLQTLKGGVPYKNYWWVYGPLMPYYYSLFFKFFGINIMSILVGKSLLMLAATTLVYLALSTIIPYYFAFLGALWFCQFNPDFFFTYNHIGGVVFLIAIIYCLCLYIQKSKTAYLYLGLLNIFLLGLVKINFGLVSLAIFILSVCLIDFLLKNTFPVSKRIFYLTAVFLCPFFLWAIYRILTSGLTIYELRQCLPYLKGDEPYNSGSFLGSSVFLFFKSGLQTIQYNLNNTLMALIILLSIAQTLFFMIRNRADLEVKKYAAVIFILLSFFIASLHEYLMSGILYRSFWAKPFWIMLIFIFIAMAVKSLPKIVHFLVVSTLMLLLFLNAFQDRIEIRQMKTGSQYLPLQSGKIFVGNQPQWVQTVLASTLYLNSHLRGDEKFLALPYDPLYYYLTQKTSPTRQLIFFDHIHIPPEQEKKIIAELERNKVNWVLLSSRMDAHEHGLGTLGKTYCPLLNEYIRQNFKDEIRFGDWSHEPGWAWNHGTRILKRIKVIMADRVH